MDKDTVIAIKALSDRLLDTQKRIDNYHNGQYIDNAEKIAEITPYTATKTAYIEDTEITFTDVPQGRLTVYMQDEEGNYPDYTVERITDRIIIHFEPLEYVTEVTISII